MKSTDQITFMERSVKATFFTAISAGLLMFVVTFERPVNGQGNRSIINSPRGPFADSLEIREREVALRSLATTMGAKKTDRPVNPEIFRQINEDFVRIQIIRQGLVSDIATGKRFEYARLSNDTSEIRKRAERLRNALALSDGEIGNRQGSFTKTEFGEQEIQDAASELCLEISRFTENPIFRSGGAYRASDALEAGRTLDTVIDLSQNIKVSAERLRKSGR